MDSYNLCSSFEWKLGIHLSEWKAARELCYRMGNAGDELSQAHFDGVIKLIREHLDVMDKLNQLKANLPTDDEIDKWHTECADKTRAGEADYFWAFEISGDYLAEIVRATLMRWGNYGD